MSTGETGQIEPGYVNETFLGNDLLFVSWNCNQVRFEDLFTALDTAVKKIQSNRVSSKTVIFFLQEINPQLFNSFSILD